MFTVIQNQGSVVTLPLNCHVMPFPIIHRGPVDTDHGCTATKIKAKLNESFDDLQETRPVENQGNL
jgi:hypothetical protein